MVSEQNTNFITRKKRTQNETLCRVLFAICSRLFQVYIMLFKGKQQARISLHLQSIANVVL